MTAPERSRLARERLSRELRRLRDEAGLTGTTVAAAAGMSQSKLSKIETGSLLPSSADVEKLLHAVSAPAEHASELLELVQSLHIEVESARVVLHRGAHRKQQQIGRIEASATIIRSFLLGMIPGLLQSAGYMKNLFSALPADEAGRATAARRERQLLLDNPAKQFVFLLPEGTLRSRTGSASMMTEQIEHIALVAQKPNVSIGVIPWTAEMPVFVTHSFHIDDDRLVTISTYTANATLTDAADIREYLDLFGKLEEVAVFGVEAQRLLTRIAEDFRRLEQD